MSKTTTKEKHVEQNENGPVRFISSPAAGPCPVNEDHTNTRIYRTAGNLRYCKCNDCGATWKQNAAEGDPVAAFLSDLANALDTSERQQLADGTKAIVMSDKDAKAISEQIRSFITS